MPTKKISDLPHKNLNEYDIQSIRSLKENGYSIKKEWQDELTEAVTIVHQRTEAIARLWKHFKLSIDQIESVLDFFGGNVSMAFEYLNNQERWPTIVPLPTIIDEAHVKFDISEAKPMILGTTATPFRPDPLR